MALKRPRADERSAQKDPETLFEAKTILAEPHAVPSGDVAFEFSSVRVDGAGKGDEV